MYQIIKDGSVIALAEEADYIRKLEDGFYLLCGEAEAQGVAVNGTPYRLMGRDGLEELEEVLLVRQDGGAIAYQQGINAEANKTELENALCEQDAVVDERLAAIEDALCEMDKL